MRKVLFMAVSALLICTSCVTKKKYLEAENGRLEAIGRGNALQEQLVDCKDAGDKLNERLAALQRDTAKMGSNIRNYQTMLNSNMTQQEKLNSLLSQKMEELNERERTINELQDMINAQNEKVQKQESPSKVSRDVEESVDKMISNRMSKAYSEWKSNQDTRPYNENIEKEYQKLLETLSPEQEEVLTKYCDEIFASGAETEEFFYRLDIKDGLRLKSTVKSVLEMMS